jgi:endonuclease/exonuclease/phosphatase family metal-dependent hydrolase
VTFLRYVFLFFNIVLALCLVAAGWSMYANPETFWPLSFFGLLFPVWIIANLLFLLFLLPALSRYALISGTAFLLSAPAWLTYVAFHPFDAEEPAKPALKVMSYNVRNFDLYNWKQGDATKKKIMALVKREQPDIICFQEFYNERSGAFATISELRQKLGYPYFYFGKTVTHEGGASWGVATFSRFPIQKSNAIRFSNSKLNSAIFTDVLVDSVMFRVFNAHLQSVYLSSGDYEYIEHVAEEQDVQMQPTRRILSKIRRGYTTRAAQAIQLKKEIRKSPYPVIVCGDFNDTPASFAYHTLAQGLNDAFLCAGFGISPTYSGFYAPFRIDYILTDEKYRASDFNTICEKLSDHYAVVCTIPLIEK